MGDRYSNRDSGRDSGRDRGGREESRGRDSGRESSRDDGGRGRESSRESSRSRDSAPTSRFVFKPRNVAQATKRATQGANDFDKILRDDVKMWTPKVGKCRIRYIPATWDGADHYGLDVFVHYGVGPDRASYLDLFKMKGEPDPISDEISAMRKDNADPEDIRQMDSKKRVLAYIIDRDDVEAGVQAWAMPWTVDRDVTLLSIDGEGGILNIDDPEEGYDIEFTRSGAGIKTEYKAIAISRRSTRLGKGEWIDYAVDNPLPSVLQYFTYEEIDKVFSGGGGQQRDERGAGRETDDRHATREESRGRDDRSRDDRGGDSRDSGGRSERDSRDDARSDRGGRGGRDSGRDTAPALSWSDVHGMTSAELDALVEERDELRNIEPNKAESDAELADWICEDLKIAKPEEGRGRNRTEPLKDDAAEDKMAKLREQRGRR